MSCVGHRLAALAEIAFLNPDANLSQYDLELIFQEAKAAGRKMTDEQWAAHLKAGKGLPKAAQQKLEAMTVYASQRAALAANASAPPSLVAREHPELASALSGLGLTATGVTRTSDGLLQCALVPAGDRTAQFTLGHARVDFEDLPTPAYAAEKAALAEALTTLGLTDKAGPIGCERLSPAAWIPIGIGHSKLLLTLVPEGGSIAPETLLEGLRSTSPYVRRAAALSPDATSEVLRAAMDNPDQYVREYAAGNSAATPEVLEKAQADRMWRVRAAVAGSINATPAMLAKALRDNNERVRGRAAENPNAPAEFRVKVERRSRA